MHIRSVLLSSLCIRYDIECKQEQFISFAKSEELQKQQNKRHIRARRPKYIAHGNFRQKGYDKYRQQPTTHDDNRKKYVSQSRRKPGSCYLCCVPYPKPPSYLPTTTTKRPNYWTPRPTRYMLL